MTDHLRRQMDYTVLPAIRGVGFSLEQATGQKDLQEKIRTLRAKLSDCAMEIEHSLFSRQPPRIYAQLRSLRTSIHCLLSALPTDVPVDPRMLEEAHLELQLEPLLCPETTGASGRNRISRWI
ncbi:MAG: hypothetical protein V1876_00755 [Candidatus Peregrinibacteria bacterium]